MNDLDNHGAYPLVAFAGTGQGWWTEGPLGLRAQGGGTPQNVALAFDTSGDRFGHGDLDGHGAYPLVAAAGFSKYEPRDTATALRAVSYKQSDVDLVMEQDGTGRGTPIVAHTLAFNGYQRTVNPDTYGPLQGDDGRKVEKGVLAFATAIPRRLTPTEFERLQGFPDDWTAVDGMKDGPRYRMMGNAVTVPVIEYIGRRILEAERSKI